ncbi:SitA5 family polymorphic toxin [Hyalangium versicolor]|uniref:SitA5 family polymorphic toxin n=1 Tax=Hyalangium versicolor TaxID=2861190 RepID=UPI001CCDE726|nr:HNH endonuclease [Hyalangium versicolor]
MSRWAILLALGMLLGSGCASTRVVHLETGQNQPLEYAPPTWNKSVRVETDSFEQALTRLVLESPLTLRPPQQGWLVRASYPSNDSDSRWQQLMSRSFGGMCKPGQRRANCLSLLDDVAGLTQWDKLGVALGLSLDPLRKSISQAVENTLAPELFYTVIATGLVGWAALAANPEPVFTKAAAIVSAVMLIYLGVETFLELVDASREMKRTTDSATTWEELQQAGQRFANRVGPEVARVFVLAVTLAVSQGMAGGTAWLASRLSMLPSFTEAATLGARQVGILLAEVGQVSSVAVVDGHITISLAPTAVAMTAKEPGSVSASPRSPRVSGDELAKLRREFEAVKARFWKNEAAVNPGAYSPENLARMRSGKPPIGPDGYPMELHHKVSLAEGGTNSFANLAIKTRTDHRLGPNYKQNHPNLP